MKYHIIVQVHTYNNNFNKNNCVVDMATLLSTYYSSDKTYTTMCVLHNKYKVYYTVQSGVYKVECTILYSLVYNVHNIECTILYNMVYLTYSVLSCTVWCTMHTT